MKNNSGRFTWGGMGSGVGVNMGVGNGSSIWAVVGSLGLGDRTLSGHLGSGWSLWWLRDFAFVCTLARELQL